MGLLKKIKSSICAVKSKRIDDGQSKSSYDMTEILSSRSEFSVILQSSSSFDVPLTRTTSMQPNASERSHYPIQIDNLTYSRSFPPISFASQLSKQARDILSNASLDISFADNTNFDDIFQYPDPELSFCGSDSSEGCEERIASQFFHGLVVITSSNDAAPSEAHDDDEYLIHSPIFHNDVLLNKSSSPRGEGCNHNSPKKHKMAHIFNEELSTLYEGREDEGSLTSLEEIDVSDIDLEHSNKQITSMLSVHDKSLIDRWSEILAMTIQGQCATQQKYILDEGEI
jgi:hypothetical protein